MGCKGLSNGRECWSRARLQRMEARKGDCLEVGSKVVDGGERVCPPAGGEVDCLHPPPLQHLRIRIRACRRQQAGRQKRPNGACLPHMEPWEKECAQRSDYHICDAVPKTLRKPHARSATGIHMLVEHHVGRLPRWAFSFLPARCVGRLSVADRGRGYVKWRGCGSSYSSITHSAVARPGSLAS